MRFHFILNFIRKSRKEIITRYPFHLIHRIDVLITFFLPLIMWQTPVPCHTQQHHCCKDKIDLFHDSLDNFVVLNCTVLTHHSKSSFN